MARDAHREADMAKKTLRKDKFAGGMTKIKSGKGKPFVIAAPKKKAPTKKGSR